MWSFFQHVFDEFMKSDAKSKILLSGILILAIFIGIMSLGSYMLYKFSVDKMEITQRVHGTINPPTDKSEDLHNISRSLEGILLAVQDLKSEIDTRVSTDNISLRCGINNAELEMWEVSVSGKNTLGLAEGDNVLLINALSPQSQSAKFRVKFVREGDKEKNTEIYINNPSAKFLGIESSNDVGVFDLKAQKIK